MRTPLPDVRGARVLTGWVTDTLREAILQGYFEPGEKIDQESIADELEVSRTPVREALKVLESEGFVDIRPHRGAFISTITSQDIREIYEVRRVIESEVVRQVTSVISETMLDELQRILDQVRRNPEDKAIYVRADIQFHDATVELVENDLLKEILDGLNNRIIRVRRFAQLQPGYHIRESHEEHYAILRAMRQRDAEQAAKLMELHLSNSARRIQEVTSAGELM
jgi:DNA-binding GntR family transcriptional regulator